MEPHECAAATTAAVSGIASNFMLDPATYAAAAEHGFGGLDFYTAGRGGVLGPVDADVVAAAFAFFEPGHVRAQWEQGIAVMPPTEAADRFLTCGHAWAREHLADDVDWSRLGSLLAAVNAAASPACAPLFGAWRAVPEPDGADPKAIALQRFHVLRELRNAVHAAAVLAVGLTPAEAVLVKSPFMAALFGWVGDLPSITDEHAARHARAEEATNHALAPAYAALAEAELAELAGLCEAAVAAVS